MSDLIFLSNVRLSFPHLVEPQRQKDNVTGKERISYSCEFIMAPDHAGFAQFMKHYSELALVKWKENAPGAMGMILADRKQRCFGRGEEKVNKKTFKSYDGYQGMVYITAGRDYPPQIIQADGSPIRVDGSPMDISNTMAYQHATRLMYGGCRVNAAIKPWLQDNKHGLGVRCDLVAVQFAGDDTPFGEKAVDASPMFSSVDVAQAAAPASPAGMPFPAFLNIS